MSYSAPSNPPWQRNTLGNAGNQPPQMQSTATMQNANAAMHYPNQPAIYGQNMGLQQQPQQGQNVGVAQYNMNQMTAAAAPMFPPVSYPAQSTRGGLNPVAFSSSQQQGPANNCNAVGVVTKVHNDCGFVDDEVFFHKNVCKGAVPKIGDRVLVEASFNQNSPFKWNATRIQIVSSTSGGTGSSMPRAPPPPVLGASNNSSSSGYNAVAPPADFPAQFARSTNRRASPPPPPRRVSPSSRSAGRKDAKHGRDEDEFERKRRREERELRERERDRERREEKRKSPEKRQRSSPLRRPSPKRRRNRATIPRYMVQIPKISLTKTQADVFELRHRYVNLYIPSDFFFSHIKWTDAFPPNSPFSIQRPCQFHVMNKSVEPPSDTIFSIDPPDADYLFSAKVMLLAIPSQAEIHQKCLTEDKDHYHEDERDFTHPTRLINFLVGVRGKNEATAVGGPWSPSLDGPNPESDPSVLIKTAIRTCNYLTGIDLSRCTQWYRFVEIYYRRSETVHKGHLIPARVETVVIFLPDINSCMPTRSEWDGLQQTYKMTLEQVIYKAEHPAEFEAPNEGDDGDGDNETAASALENATQEESTANESEIEAVDLTDQDDGTEGDPAKGAAATGADEGAHEKEENAGKYEASHHSELEPRTMKIQQLRDELTARGLSAKGLKPQLIARLAKALNAEQQEEESKEEQGSDNVDLTKSDENADAENADDNDGFVDPAEVDMNDIVVLDEYDASKAEDSKSVKKETVKTLDEKERRQLEKRYTLPESPQIIVHPSKTAKSGKFDCAVQSLSVLLDYRTDDTKEHLFEVSLFAELFNEMLMRDFGFNIYKELVLQPEKPKEAKDESTKKKDEHAERSTGANDAEKDVSPGEKSSKDTEPTKRDSKNSHEDNKERRASENDKEKCDKKTSIKDRRPSGKRPRDDESEDDGLSIKSGERKKRIKTVVVKPDLLLSFIYFDTTHCGYLFEKDIEELFFIIGLNLSRAQVRKLLAKVVSRDALYYRKLTDKPKEERSTEEGKAEAAEVNHEIDVVQLAKGNKCLLPVFKDAVGARPSENATVDNGTGMVSYNGSLIDVGKLIEQMKRCERGREETEELLNELRKQHTDLQGSHSKSSTKIKDLQSDVKSLTRKLSDTEQSLSSFTRKNSDYYNILSSIYDRVSPIFNRSKDRDRDQKHRSDKEKEKDDSKDPNKDSKDSKSHVKDEKKDVKEEKAEESKANDSGKVNDVDKSGATSKNSEQTAKNKGSDSNVAKGSNGDATQQRGQSKEPKDDAPLKKKAN